MNNYGLVKPFAPIRTLAIVVMVLLGMCIFLDFLRAIFLFLQAGLISRVVNGDHLLPGEATSSDLRINLVVGMRFGIYILTIIFFMMWFYRTHRNLESLGSQGMEYSPGWAVGSFFVPFLNLVRPYQVMCEVWKASDPAVQFSYGTNWKNLSSSPLVTVWWIVWILGEVIARVFLQMNMGGNPRKATLDELMSMTYVGIISDVTMIVAGILAILVVNGVTKRQEERFQRISTMPTSSPDFYGTPPYGEMSYGAVPTPVDPITARYNLATEHYKSGRFLEALDAYRQITLTNPNYAEAYYSMGLAYLAMGDKASAQKQLAYLQNRPDLAQSLQDYINR